MYQQVKRSPGQKRKSDVVKRNAPHWLTVRDSQPPCDMMQISYTSGFDTVHQTPHILVGRSFWLIYKYIILLPSSFFILVSLRDMADGLLNLQSPRGVIPPRVPLPAVAFPQPAIPPKCPFLFFNLIARFQSLSLAGCALVLISISVMV